MTGRSPAAVDALAGFRVRTLDLAADAEAMAALAREVNAATDGDWFPTAETIVVDWAPGPSFEPSRDTLVAFDGDDLVAAVDVDWRQRTSKIVHAPELWVRPSHRGRGIEAALLEWAEDHARRLVDAGLGGTADLPHELGAGANESNAERRELLEAHGYVPVRWFFDMRRSLADAIPDAELPAGLEIRPVRPEHHRAIWDADVEGFRDHWEAAVRYEEDFIALFSHPHTVTSLWRIAWDGDEVAGVVMNVVDGRPTSDGAPKIGTLEHISTRRRWRGRGVATALIVESLRALRARGLAEAELGVDAENPSGALGLYERLGFRRHRTWIVYRRPL